MSESIVLGYWGIRGRGQVPRLLLQYTQANWSQKKYFSQDQWKGIGRDQTSLGIPFPNLPYIIHDQLKISQSKALMNYIINISNKKQLFGKNIKHEAIVGNLVSVFAQIMGKIIQLNFSGQSFENTAQQVQKFVQSKLQSFQLNFKEKQFVLGYLTLADFMISQTSYYIQNVFPSLFTKYPSLKVIRNSFQNVEQIKNYYNKQSAVKGPFLPPIGKIKF